MILLNKSNIIATVLIVTGQLTSIVDAHGFLQSPRSRNYHASIDPKYWGGTANDPAPESCPHCLNIGGTEARCGIVGDHNYDYPSTAIGTGVLPPIIQATYEEGSVIDVESVITAHHKGHFEVKACPIQPYEVATQACFDAHPLMFIEDALYDAPVDPLYPGRAYIPRTDYPGFSRGSNGDYYFHHKFKLPEGLEGGLVLIQWYYLTANSCLPEGYDTYDFPEYFYPDGEGSGISMCDTIPPDGRGWPEQFWNCAEVSITTTSGTSSPTVSPLPTALPSKAPTPPPVSVTTTTSTTTTTTSATTSSNNLNCEASSTQCGADTTCESLGFAGMCCSQYGWCGTSIDHCGDCCQSGACFDNPPSPSAPYTPLPTPFPTPPTNTGFQYSADHGEDSRLIAYVGNWQTCPTVEQVDAYSHIVIAFAVSYTWNPTQNACDEQCNISNMVPICENANNQELVDSWRAAGKKVILSFGGAGMGGSWSGDQNNCWDYCFGKEETLSSQLVGVIDNQNFDGIDIDYEYCYDTQDKQAGRCLQRTQLYSDAKAQTFLDDLTSKLRSKLDALQVSNGYSRGRYEVTHAPMDSDLTPSSSAYFQILHNRRDDLDFLMPQFYNGVTRPAIDGVEAAGAGALSAADMFASLSNELFDKQAHKVVFGHCIADCSGTGSNANAAQAAKIMHDLKSYNGGEFSCNGGAFFWVAQHDSNGGWSDAVVGEVSKTAGCSSGVTASPTNNPIKVTSSPIMSPATLAPTDVLPTSNPVQSSTTTSSTTINTGATVTTTTSTTTTGQGITCTAIPQSELPDGKWATNDAECKKCEVGYEWWPCGDDICDCTSHQTTTSSNCAANTVQCGPGNPCNDGLCCSQWGYCGSSEAHCDECCQSNCQGLPF